MKIKTRDLTLIPLFTVLMIICSKIEIPVGLIPVTLQYFACLLTGILLGARRAFIAQALYLLIGLIGLPVFAAGGGIGYVLQPSFGYLIGMLCCSTLTGWLTDRIDPDRSKLKTWQLVPITLTGWLVVYLFGLSYLLLIKNVYAGASQTFLWAIQVGMIPFLISDGIFSLLVAVAGPRLRRMTRQYLTPKQAPDSGAEPGQA